jgi:hypothetical protein
MGSGDCLKKSIANSGIIPVEKDTFGCRPITANDVKSNLRGRTAIGYHFYKGYATFGCRCWCWRNGLGCCRGWCGYGLVTS